MGENLPHAVSRAETQEVLLALKLGLTRSSAGGRYWVRTSDLFGVKSAHSPSQAAVLVVVPRQTLPARDTIRRDSTP